METLGLYEPEELSLFGGDSQLLLGLGSPLEPEAPDTAFPDVARDATVGAKLGKATFEFSSAKLTTSATTSLGIDNNQLQSLDASWLDTQLDLDSFLSPTARHSHGESTVSSATTSLAPSVATSPTSEHLPLISILEAPAEPEITAEDLFNQISHGLMEIDNPEPDIRAIDTAASDSTDLLGEIFSQYVESLAVPDPGVALSPVSVDDVESLLSSPVSPAAGPITDVDAAINSSLESLLTSRASSPGADSDPLYVPYDDTEPAAGPARTKSKRRAKPYNQGQPVDRKERKKMQNKTAALKYRQKKKNESESITDQCTRLENRNRELKDKVDSMTREIQYLKDLMGEVVKARSSKKSS